MRAVCSPGLRTITHSVAVEERSDEANILGTIGLGIRNKFRMK
jgi:hypothetical protein